MKLAEALVERADLQKRLAQIKQRALANARYQEGETPAEDPSQLRVQFEAMAGDLAVLVRKINRSNLVVALPTGEPLTDALARRDSLQLRRTFLVGLANAANATQARAMRSELRTVSAVPIAQLRGDADLLAREFRELDTAIQGTNWTADLVE